MEYRSTLSPKVEEGANYSVDDEGAVSYNGMEGLRIDVQYLTDRTLNEMFPDDSEGGKHSTNPYTYGDWIDPNLGYTPNRFTVFRISVYNYTYAKMFLDPLQAVLLTDRGERLNSYSIAPKANLESLEGYYRALRGISGNEHYRFAKRIGIVRGTIFGEDELIFKGENYSGLIVFPPLHSKVKEVRLVFKDVAYKFDASGKPVETIDIPFDFHRTILRKTIEEKQVEKQVEKTTRLVVQGPLQLTGNLPGDVSRNAAAFNSMVNQNIQDLNRCFQTEFDKGEAIAGEVVIQFAVQVNGLVEAVRVVRSSVVSKAVEKCIVEEVEGWRFNPAGQFIEEAGTREELGALGEERRPGGAIARPRSSAALTEVVVVYPLIFESIAD
jgi:hypothetical protein